MGRKQYDKGYEKGQEIARERPGLTGWALAQLRHEMAKNKDYDDGFFDGYEGAEYDPPPEAPSILNRLLDR